MYQTFSKTALRRNGGRDHSKNAARPKSQMSRGNQTIKLIMKKFIIILAVICYGNLLWSQDIIILKNGEEIKAAVQEIGLNDVKYKKYENLNGPTYTLLKADIFMIKYENGEKDVFTAETTPAKTVVIQTPQTFDIGATTLTTKDGSMVVIQTPQTFDIGTTTLTAKGGNVFIGDRKLGTQEVRNILSSNKEALDKYNSGLATEKAGGIVGLVGLIAVPVGLIGMLASDWSSDTAVIYTGVLAGGLGLWAIGEVVGLIGSSNIKTGIKFYNNSITGKTMAYNLQFGMTNSGGIGFMLNF